MSSSHENFEEFWCGTDKFGPFTRINGHANFTPCFDNLFGRIFSSFFLLSHLTSLSRCESVLTVLRLFMIPLLAFRFLQAYRAPHVSPRKRSIKYRIQVRHRVFPSLFVSHRFRGKNISPPNLPNRTFRS